MTNTSRAHRNAIGLCATSNCANEPMENRTICKPCAIKWSRASYEHRKLTTGKAPLDACMPRNRRQRQFTGEIHAMGDIHSQSPQTTELAPREHMVLRRDPPKPKRVVIQPGADATNKSGRRQSEKAVFAERGASSIVLLG
jgi:hypothetical protein